MLAQAGPWPTTAPSLRRFTASATSSPLLRPGKTPPCASTRVPCRRYQRSAMKASGAKSFCIGPRPPSEPGMTALRRPRTSGSYERLEGFGDRIINSQSYAVLHRTFAGAPPSSIGVCSRLFRALIAAELTRFRRGCCRTSRQSSHATAPSLTSLWLTACRIGCRTRTGKTWWPTKKNGGRLV